MCSVTGVVHVTEWEEYHVRAGVPAALCVHALKDLAL